MMKFFAMYKRIIAILLATLMLMSGVGFASEDSGELDLMINTDLDDGEWWNILLLGTDSRDISKYYGLTDTIMILSINTRTNEVKLTSVMRDIWLNIPGHGENKINAANSRGGPQLVMRTVNQYFGMNISDYVLVGIEAMADIIDEIGGIRINVTEDEMNQINTQMTYDAAEFDMNHVAPLEEFGDDILLNGNQAVAYARIRNLDSDYVRTQRQRSVIVAIATELQNENIATMLSVISTLVTYVQTNLEFGELIDIAGVGLMTDLNALEQYRIPVDGTFTSETVDGVWSMRPDFARNTELLHQFIYTDGEEE